MPKGTGSSYAGRGYESQESVILIGAIDFGQPKKRAHRANFALEDLLSVVNGRALRPMPTGGRLLS